MKKFENKIYRSKGAFRALRESMGLSAHDVAKALAVRERTANRWESYDPDYNVPDYAWDWLDDMRAKFERAINQALGIFGESGASSASITYYKTQEEYDAFGRDEGPYGFANAISREVALELEARGYEVRLLFPEEADGALTAAVTQTRSQAN